MKKGTPDHPKTLDLAANLGIPIWAACGILETLWHWTAKYAPCGDIGKFTDAAIARGIGWTEDSDRLLNALVCARFVDNCAHNRRAIHDWSTHAEDAVHMRLYRTKTYFCDGVKPKASRVSREERHDIEKFFEDNPFKAKGLQNAQVLCAQETHENRTTSAHCLSLSLSLSPPLPSPTEISKPPLISCPTRQKAVEIGPEEKTILEIPTKGKEPGPFKVTLPIVEEFQKDFPGIDVLQEIRSARAWSVSNPDRQKTMRGVMRFLCAWLSKAQNRPLINGNHAPPSKKSSGLPTVEELEARGVIPKSSERRRIDLSGIGNLGTLKPGQEPPI